MVSTTHQDTSQTHRSLNPLGHALQDTTVVCDMCAQATLDSCGTTNSTSLPTRANGILASRLLVFSSCLFWAVWMSRSTFRDYFTLRPTSSLLWRAHMPMLPHRDGKFNSNSTCMNGCNSIVNVIYLTENCFALTNLQCGIQDAKRQGHLRSQGPETGSRGVGVNVYTPDARNSGPASVLTRHYRSCRRWCFDCTPSLRRPEAKRHDCWLVSF